MITLNEASAVVQLTSRPVMSTEGSHIGIKDKSGFIEILISGYFSSYKTTTALLAIGVAGRRWRFFPLLLELGNENPQGPRKIHFLG